MFIAICRKTCDKQMLIYMYVSYIYIYIHIINTYLNITRYTFIENLRYLSQEK